MLGRFETGGGEWSGGELVAGVLEMESGIVVGRCGVDLGGAEGGEEQGYLIESMKVTVGFTEGSQLEI